MKIADKYIRYEESNVYLIKKKGFNRGWCIKFATGLNGYGRPKERPTRYFKKIGATRNVTESTKYLVK